MELKTGASLSHGFSVLSRLTARGFPTPKFLAPAAAGIEISNWSIKWVVLEPDRTGLRVATYGLQPLPEGVVVNGVIKDAAKFSAALTEVKKNLGGVQFAHVALPEEAAYVFEMELQGANDHEQTMRLIEFEFEARVPISLDAAVFDFDIIRKSEMGDDIGVTVFPRELAESYVAAFRSAGIGLLSLELEARSIARAISVHSLEDPVTLLVDFGRERTGFAVLKYEIPIFTSTVEVGGDTISNALMGTLGLTEEEAITFRNEQGLVPQGDKKAQGLDAVVGVASALSDEVARHYHYWDTRRNEHGERMTPVARIVLVGGSANLRGLTDYIAGRVQAPTMLGDAWHRVRSSDSYIPPIDRQASLQYVTAIGLALRSFAI
jgi:type IV pilus assembly protein PilM